MPIPAPKIAVLGIWPKWEGVSSRHPKSTSLHRDTLCYVLIVKIGPSLWAQHEPKNKV